MPDHAYSHILHCYSFNQRALVLDYLCLNSYTQAARAFVRDTAVKHLDADGDELMAPATSEGSSVDLLADTLDERLAPAELRRGTSLSPLTVHSSLTPPFDHDSDIRIHILSGRVDDALALLNTHFPSVLSSEREPLLGHSHDKPTNSDGFDYVPPTSVDPTHLALNLRIHAFIEAARTVALPFHPSRAHSPLSDDDEAPSPTAPPKFSGSGEPSAHQQDLLHRAQNLYAEVHSLVKPEDRVTYIEELSKVTGLLAYTDPENSPMAPYLTQERREAIAAQIESAILCKAFPLHIGVS